MNENTKNTETVIIEEEALQETANIFFQSARKAMNAGLGAVDLAREEVANLFEKAQIDIEEIFNNLAVRGETFGAENRQRVDEAVNTRKTKAEEAVSDIRSTIDTQIEKALHTINIPTKADIDDLSKKIANLTKKVNALAKDVKTS
ncbi:MAG: poly(hydroxyalkanoate) granule-associated protein [Cellvibrionaceae bacterium]|jgi:poly(hydroxyalkanoate) granule-associated protein